jgi:aspartate 1-decarboxylase
MQRTLLGGKIHRATVTRADLHYVGSITIDKSLMDAADLIIIMSFRQVEERERDAHRPRVVHVDRANRIVELGDDPAAPVPGSAGQLSGALAH